MYNLNLENFMWADQKVKVCYIFHIKLFKCEECFMNWSTMFYVTLKLSKVQLCMKHIPLPC